MAESSEFGGCRHCGHTPVHASARACPYCGGIAPYTRTPPRRSKNTLVMLLSLAVIALVGGLIWFFAGR